MSILSLHWRLIFSFRSTSQLRTQIPHPTSISTTGCSWLMRLSMTMKRIISSMGRRALEKLLQSKNLKMRLLWLSSLDCKPGIWVLKTPTNQQMMELHLFLATLQPSHLLWLHPTAMARVVSGWINCLSSMFVQFKCEHSNTQWLMQNQSVSLVIHNVLTDRSCGMLTRGRYFVTWQQPMAR